MGGDPLESCEMNFVSLGQHLKKKEKEIELNGARKKNKRWSPPYVAR